MRAREQPSEQWRSGARRKSKVRKNKRAKENKRAKSKEQKGKRMRRPGIEPGASRWQRDILPLNQRRFDILQTHTHKHKPTHNTTYHTHKPHHNTTHTTSHHNTQTTHKHNNTFTLLTTPPHTTHHTNIQYTHTDSDTRTLGNSETNQHNMPQTGRRTTSQMNENNTYTNEGNMLIGTRESRSRAEPTGRKERDRRGDRRKHRRAST